MKLPKLCCNKSRMRAFVLERGKRIYLGPWGTPETEAAYELYIHNLTSKTPQTPLGIGGASVVELVASFFEAKADYYVKNGKQTRQLQRFKAAAEYPVKYFGSIASGAFGPKKLLECRAMMEASGRFSRKYINTLITCWRTIVKFGVEHEIVPPETLTALQAIEPLKRGRSKAGERPPVQAAPAQIVEATCKELPPVVSAMVAIQRFTGMRPGEVTQMKVGDIFIGKDVWIYTLRSDKTDYRRPEWAKKRIPLGPKAQAVLVPFLERKKDDPDAFLFSPKDAAADRATIARKNRKTPPSKQMRERDERDERRTYAPCYNVNSYAKAIKRATKRAGVEHWTPNQLRHLYATEIRAKYGLECSQLMLGHAKADVTQIYAERDFKRALDVAKIEG